ncbi:RNA polymerase 2 transcription factor related protein [Grosmannia clavigera kw1407]|uniref:RNA polymerase 2 transcription factor related protein n=1 Tax=Grosmannia clavigera (strain kw1407 / UAMH 11150) TaxID=655863 RepID=F0XTE6_GROCL|nr:RNA polymerase 2 transcription factor related protein [Grosmannia clavigera kw1407]EFW98488.1 RNA polymerase 2 transcription factor related protein [Grosmannia clavigera kw1407]
MSMPWGKAVYKKKDGIIAVADDQSLVTWTPTAGGAAVSLPTVNITNLQQTPDTAAKVMLKIFEKPPGSDGEPSTYLFHFNSPTDARTEANAVKDLLSKILADIRSNDPSVPRPADTAPPAAPTRPDSGSTSAAMSFASATTSKPTVARWFDDSQLRADIELQQSLMKKDKTLHQTYMDAQKSKPDSISDASFNGQFWSTRTTLLRAHAIETHQKKGAYNVLSTIKPRTVDNELKLNISVEQVQMIFKQHPLVKRIYNDNVPRISESQFWARFFLSRLSKKLRGERVLDSERADPIFDRYDESDDTIAASLILSAHVPYTIDLEANEEDQGGFRGGNRKDVEMRPRSNIPIVRTLNSLSEKIMAGVAPSDPDPTTSEVVDAGTQAGLELADLRGDIEARRIVLHVREQSRFFNQDPADSADTDTYRQQVPSEVLFDVQADIDTLEGDGAGGIDLHAGIGVDEDSDSDGEDGQARGSHVGSRAARQAAQKQLFAAIAQRRSERYGHSADEQAPMGIPAEIAQKAYLTNATTTEFLRQFWNAFLSGDADRAQELAHHVEALSKSLGRIEAIADEAEQARNRVIAEKKEEIRVLYSRTGKRLRWRPEMIGGGRRAVQVLLGPTIHGLQTAQDRYQAALAAEGLKLSTESTAYRRQRRTTSQRSFRSAPRSDFRNPDAPGVMRQAFRMRPIGTPALHAAPSLYRYRYRYRYRSIGSWTLAFARRFGLSAAQRARPDDDAAAEDKARPDGDTESPDVPVISTSSSTSTSSLSSPAPPPETDKPTETEALRDAFSGLVGRGRSSRHRSPDGLPPVRLPDWFLRENVRRWETPSLPSAQNSISHNLAEARRLMFPNIAPQPTTAATPPPTAVLDAERERMQQFFEWMLHGAAWDANKVADAAADLRRGYLDAITNRSTAVAAAASYLTAALAEEAGQADLSAKIDPDNALHIPEVLSRPAYRDHVRSLTEHGIDVCVSPGADQDVARGLPFNYDYGERIGFTELCATVAAELRAVSPPARPAKDFKRPISVLALMNYTGRGKAVSVVENVARSLSADVVHLDAAAIAEIVGSYLGQTAYWARGSLSMLGYTMAEKNGRLARRYPTKRDEEDDDDDDHLDSSMVMSRLPIAFMRQSGLGPRLSSKAFPSDMDDKWDDLKTNNVLEAIVKATTTTTTTTTVSAEPRKMILHVHNFFELSSTVEGSEILAKLRTIVDRLWQRRHHRIVLVGSASTHADVKPSLVERAEELRLEGYHIIPFRVQRTASTPCLAEQMERQDYFSENMANIRAMTTALTAGSLQPPATAWDWARCRDDVDETLQASLSHVVYDIDWVYRLVTLVLGSTADKTPRCDEKSFVAALRAIGGEELWWEKRAGAKAPYFYPLSTTPDAAFDRSSSEPGDPQQQQQQAQTTTEYNEYEKKLLANVIDRQAIATTFADVVCPAETVDSLKALTSLSLVRPEAFLYGVLATERIPGCLLYGPPGTGKTLLAKAVAKQGGASMIEVSAASINDMWLGNSEKNVQALFSLARKMAPVVIFLDEADALLGARQTGPGGRAAHRETITQFLREWDGLKSMNAFIMVATNRPFDLDEAVLRRLPRRILVDLPLRPGRLRILEVMLRDELLDSAVDLNQLAAETELYSGSDLKNLCVAAAMEAVREEVRAQDAHVGPDPFVFADRRILRRAHFDRALQDIGASISEDMASLQAIRRFDERYGDRRRKKRRHMGFEVAPTQLNSEAALVRQAVP